MRILIFLFIPFISFSQEDNYERLVNLPKVEFESAVNDSIIKLESLDLWNFLKTLRDDFNTDFTPFRSSLILKIETTKWSNEMYFLLTILIEQKVESTIIENKLNNRKNIWDKGEWGERFWRIIKQNKLNIKEGAYYSVNENGQKKYDVKLFLSDKIEKNELGSNPLLFLDYNLKSYPENELLEKLEKLNIKSIEFNTKEEGPILFGKRGLDGVIKVLTN